jgi:hypothetical protein
LWRSLRDFARGLRLRLSFFLTGGVLVGSSHRGMGHPPVEVRLLKRLEDCLCRSGVEPPKWP